MSTLDVVINGTPERVAGDSSVADLVSRWAGRRPGVAVAVNDAVIPRADWPSVTLAAGDRVEILTAVQGG